MTSKLICNNCSYWKVTTDNACFGRCNYMYSRPMKQATESCDYFDENNFLYNIMN